MLASGSLDDTIRMWDAETGAHLRTLKGHRSSVYSVAFSPDGSLLASGSVDNTIRLWDAETGAHLRTLQGHTDFVNSVAFSPDGSLLASGSDDETIRLWDAETGARLRTLQGHTDWVFSVVFSPDGSLLASGSRDNTIRLWELPDTRMSITVLPVDAPAIGDQLTLNIDITGGENVTGYQARVIFDETALRYVESANGDYLPDDSFFVPPVVEGDEVILGATSLAEDSSGDGTLATLTFEFIAFRESTLTLSEGGIVNNAGERLPFLFRDHATIVGVPRLREDINLDGIVDILDLTLVAASFGKDARRRDPADGYGYGDVNGDGIVDTADLVEIEIINASEGDVLDFYTEEEIDHLGSALNPAGGFIDDPADVNADGVIDIVDLVLVAGALGNAAAAPSAYPQALALLTAKDVQQWLSQAQYLNLTDATSQRGILFLEHLLAALTPKKTSLLPNYPNPFNPETWIPYQLAESADVTLRIYAVNGTIVRTLALGHQPIGIYHDKSRAAYWDGKNALGESVASGVYFYTLTAGDFTATRKLLIRK